MYIITKILKAQRKKLVAFEAGKRIKVERLRMLLDQLIDYVNENKGMFTPGELEKINKYS